MFTEMLQAPWKTISVDFVGLLPKSTHGNTMLLVLIDRFSKCVELAAVRKTTSEVVIKAMRERIITKGRSPKKLISDKGVQFRSHKFRAQFHQLTAFYTPQKNPAERTKRTIKTNIAQFTGTQHSG